MDKNKIKSFAIWARRNLIAAVSEKANTIGISEDKIEDATAVQGGFIVEGKEALYHFPKSHRDALVSQVKEKGFEQVMEEVAYTWFNRFMGLRYMEVNDYLPTGVRILSSSVEGKIEPDVLTKVSEIIDELGLNANEIYDLLDTGDTLDREKAYRIILVKQCNELGKIIPQMFEKISDYTELLLPDNLLEEGSVIRKMVEDIEESDWLEEVEIIGWMYQYYNTENNELVYDGDMKRSKITKELLPAATQIFTPDWVVKYMVENSLGRLSQESTICKSEIKNNWKYYIDKVIDKKSIINLEEIKIIDPSMGSGHILVYAFEVLMQMYLSSGYNERQATICILSNNIYGLDIDERATQIACFAIIMKARKYNKRIFRQTVKINLCTINQSNNIDNSLIKYISEDDRNSLYEIEKLFNIFIDAKEIGSVLKTEYVNCELIKSCIEKKINSETQDIITLQYNSEIMRSIMPLINQYEIMINKYDVVITNPPYLNSSRMSEYLSKYVAKNYPNSKSDFSMIFYEKSIYDFCKKGGYISFITTTSWMFLKSFENLRKFVINNLEFETLVDFGTELFEGKVGHNPIVAWINKNEKPTNNLNAIRLVDYCYSRKSEKEAQFFNEENFYSINQEKFSKIVGNPIAYWVSDNYYNLFEGKCISDEFVPKFGMSVGDGERFIRFWYEVNSSDIVYDCKNEEDFIKENKKWNVLDKGGSYRRWYGNKSHVVFWKDNGKEIKEHSKSAVRSPQYFFKPHISWTLVSSGKYSARYFEEGYILDTASNCLYFNNIDKMEMVLGYLNTTIGNEILKILNPTLNYSCGVIGAMPYKDFEDERIKRLVNENIKLSKVDWNSYETSFEFKVHPLCILPNDEVNFKLCDIYNKWEMVCETRFIQLKQNEEMINKIFIEVYNLNNELEEFVCDKDITLRKASRERDIKSLLSYIVGCIFGRYSINTEELVNISSDLSSNYRNCQKCSTNEVFKSNIDNIIPITEDEYFEGDMISRIIEFVERVYGHEALEENLDFIADSIGRKASETARQVIRRYFIKDFYKDHIKVYQKRPIYWMFESGKNDGFKCLVYMHRYNEQTVAKIRTDYLHTLQRKYESEINRLQLVADSEEYTTKDRTNAKKKIDRISKQLEECKEYDQVVAHLANEKISIDLDDGVKVNYAKFQDIKVINSKGKEVKMNLLAKI